MAAQYQQETVPKAQQSLLKSQGLHNNDAAKRSAIRSQPQSMFSYSTVASMDSKCTICQGYHTFTSQAGETRSGSRLTDCADVFMKMPEECGKIIKEVKGCRFGTNWNHTSHKCCISRRFPCREQDGTIICARDHHSSLHGSKSKNFKSMFINRKTCRRRASGQGKGAKGQTVNTDTLTMVALYSIPVRTSIDRAKGSFL